MYKKVILLDLDGVLNTYDGVFDENSIPSIREGAFEFVKQLSVDYMIKIFTTRNRMLALEWIRQNNLKDYISDVTNVKEPCYLIIDDRCINFSGDYVDLKIQIDNFSAWYKQKG